METEVIEKSPKANLLYNKSSHSRVRLDSSNQGVDIEDPCHMESSHDVSRSGMEVEYGEGMRGNFTSAPKALSKRNLGVKSSKSLKGQHLASSLKNPPLNFSQTSEHGSKSTGKE